MVEAQTVAVDRRVGLLLGIGIFVLPLVFAWFTLRKGHSLRARLISFGWLILVLGAWAVGGAETEGPPTAATAEKAASPAVAPEARPAPAKRPEQITLAQYARLETGMTYREAVEILGREGEEISTSELGGYRTVMYQWKNRGGANMNAMFQNDGLVQKAQFGLR